MPEGKNPRKQHSVADHLHGDGHDHVHDDGKAADHDHDHFFEDEAGPEGNALWVQDHVSLRSVGIDIGSSGTQVIFSRINLRRMGEELSSRYFVVSRETLFQSPISLTPYKSEELIDDAELASIIDQAFADAGLHPDDIDAGVVILTGEALRRENAEAIAACSPSSAASSCARAQATTWKPCSPPTGRAPRGSRMIRASAYSMSISAAGPPSSPSWIAAK